MARQRGFQLEKFVLAQLAVAVFVEEREIPGGLLVGTRLLVRQKTILVDIQPRKMRIDLILRDVVRCNRLPREVHMERNKYQRHSDPNDSSHAAPPFPAYPTHLRALRNMRSH